MFNKVADRLERYCGHPLALVLFILWCAAVPALNVDVANYGISVFTAALLLLTLGAQRRSAKALHAKLDEQIRKDEKTDSKLAHIEDLTEDEIEAKRS